jgi:phosphotransferase system enzyme I (PtsI)
VSQVPEPLPPERLERAIDRFHQARETARKEIQELKEQVLKALGDHYAGILEAQLLILDDPRLVKETIQRMRVGRVTPRWALKEVVADFLRRFDAVDDPYLRERGGELSDVHRRLQRILRGEPSHPQAMPEGPWVVVAHTLGPADAVALARKGVVGLATDVGGRTSHTAILAQALSVPAVAGLRDVSQRVVTDDAIILDGDSGAVYLLPSAADTEQANEKHRAWVVRQEAMVSARDLPAVTGDGVEVTLRANIEFPTEVDSALRYGAQGIGLYRSEFLFLTCAPNLPTEEEHFRTYLQIAEQVAPHPAVIRTLDLGGEKYFHEVLDRKESNPVLGLRAIRLCLGRPDIFRPQLRGLLRAATQSNLQVMLPLVISAEEISEVRRLMAEEAERLKADGTPARADVPLGIMIEVPAAASAADILARHADFFSIGTNDLIQYALAVDRGNESVAHLYQPLHAGLLRMIRFIVQSADIQGIPVSLCGEMAADCDATAMLVGLGLRELSVQPRAIAAVREAVRKVDAGQAKRAAEEALKLPRASEVEPHASPDRS